MQTHYRQVDFSELLVILLVWCEIISTTIINRVFVMCIYFPWNSLYRKYLVYLRDLLNLVY